ncbi:MAG: quinol oxidase subunit 4 [Flavobacterium sp.]
MKSLKPYFIIFILSICLLSLTFTSCVVHRTVVVKERRLPPGQAKKVYGGSARDYAPGQRKKHHRN